MMEMAQFYTWRKCSTCRDAKKTLDKLGIVMNERDFFEEQMSREELSELAKIIGIDGLFSWRSPSAKPYRERRDCTSEDELIDAMLQEPRLIRRPILMSADNPPIVGFDADAYATLKK